MEVNLKRTLERQGAMETQILGKNKMSKTGVPMTTCSLILMNAGAPCRHFYGLQLYKQKQHVESYSVLKLTPSKPNTGKRRLR